MRSAAVRSVVSYDGSCGTLALHPGENDVAVHA